MSIIWPRSEILSQMEMKPDEKKGWKLRTALRVKITQNMAQSDGLVNGREESTENFKRWSTSSEGYGTGKCKTEFFTEHHGQVTSTCPYHGVPGSSPGPQTGYPDRVSHGLHQTLQEMLG